jgi:type IV pilus assembly protein PilY1
MKNIILLSILCITFLGAKSLPPGSVSGGLPANVLLVQDNSLSMSWFTSSQPSGLVNVIDVAIDTNGDIYFLQEYDTNGGFIKKLDKDGNFISRFGVEGYRDGEIPKNPKEIITDSQNNLYILTASKIVKLDSDGNFVQNISGRNISSIHIDKDDNLYLTTWLKEVKKYDKHGTLLLEFDISFRNPDHIVADTDGNIYLYAEYSIKKYDKDGNFIKSYGHFSSDPINDPEGFRTVTDMAIDSANNIYINSDGSSVYPHIKKLNSDLVYIKQHNIQAIHSFNVGRASYRRLTIDKNDTISVLSWRYMFIDQYDTDFNYKQTLHKRAHRIDRAISLVKNLVTSAQLTANANFGLMTWTTATSTMEVLADINVTGASKIYDIYDDISNPHIPDKKMIFNGHSLLDALGEKIKWYFFENPNSPLIENAWCQNNIVVIIADGAWDAISDERGLYLFEKLYKEHGIKTFVVSLLPEADPRTPEDTNLFQHEVDYTKSVELSKVAGTHPNSPVYSEDSGEIYTKLLKYIHSEVESSYSFSTPVIQKIQSGDYAYQAMFDYKVGHQWQGRIKKYSLDADGYLDEVVYDIGEVLHNTPETARSIWTIDKNLPASPTRTNNFHLSNTAQLKQLIYDGNATNLQTQNLIKFVRGIDSYDENEDGSYVDERWKLADVYNSQLTLVGPPNAFTRNTLPQTEAYYRHSNDYDSFKNAMKNREEILYAGSNGGMLHAFLSASGEELWGFIPPNLLEKLKDMESTGLHSSESIYGVDGSMSVKDVYIDGDWKSVLVCGLGAGGAGYFALDVTNPRDPKHLFSFLNDKLNNMVYYWDENGEKQSFSYGSVASKYDFRKLGDATSTPHILNIKTSPIERKWVAVFGGGYSVSSGSGSSVFVIDLENGGEILRRIDLNDKVGNGIINSVPQQLSIISHDSASVATYGGYLAYVNDLEGKTWKIDFRDSGTLYETSLLFDGGSTVTNGRYLFNKFVPGLSKDGKIFGYFGTGDKYRPEDGSANRMFALKDDSFPDFATPQTTYGDIKNLSIDASCPDTSKKGWFYDLNSSAKVTGNVAIDNGIVYVPVYTPSDSGVCSAGIAKIVAYDMSCGTIIDEIVIAIGIPGDVVISDGKIYVGISKPSVGGKVKIKDGWEVQDNMAIGTTINNMGKKDIQIKSWREVR